MAVTRRQAMAGLVFSPAIFSSAWSGFPNADFYALTPTPPMGWNSWDSFGPTIREDAARANAAIMASKLLPHGYRFFTIDIQWYEPGADGYEYRKGAELSMDRWGRLTPAENRFPSAAGGAGFKPLADYVHRLGLKFGIHVMRGVPRLAADRNLPILGTPYRAGDIADRAHVCEWNTDMYGVDMSKPGAQDYYNSIFRLYAEWGVDFVKVDDLSRPYDRNRPEVEAIRAAIDACGRPMVLSLSPGETPLDAAAHVSAHANMWRISDDFWDSWPALLEQFARLRNWAKLPRAAGTWPDADMLPLGLLQMGKRKTNFTPAERKTLMSLWSISRSPLIMGGDLRALDDDTAALLTNDEVLAVDQFSADNREAFYRNDAAAWVARARNGAAVVALFNLGDVPATVSFDPAMADAGGRRTWRDLWTHTEFTAVSLSPLLPPHGAGLYAIV